LKYYIQSAKAIYYQSIEPTILKEAEARQKRILDADYSAIDLSDYAHTTQHLSREQATRTSYLFATKISKVVLRRTGRT
jgi:hypothetical protein